VRAATLVAHHSLANYDTTTAVRVKGAGDRRAFAAAVLPKEPGSALEMTV
jgi:hypothetical protein